MTLPQILIQHIRFYKNLHDYECLGLSNEVDGGVLDEST